MKNAISKIAVFAIVLFCAQVAFGQSGKVVCYDDNSWCQDVWIDTPYFSADVIAEADCNGSADAQVDAPTAFGRKWCPDNCGYENIGRHDAGGINVSISCTTYGYGSYAVAEAWGEW